MSEVANAVEEVVDAMVTNLSLEKGTTSNGSSSPAKSTEANVAQSEINDIAEESTVSAPSTDSPVASKGGNKGTPKSARKERREAAETAAAKEAVETNQGSTAPEDTATYEEPSASGPVPMNMESEPEKARKKKLNSQQRRKLRDQRIAAAKAEAEAEGESAAVTAPRREASAIEEPAEKASEDVVSEPPLPKRNKKAPNKEAVATTDGHNTTANGTATEAKASIAMPEHAADAKAPAKQETKRAKAAPAKTAAVESHTESAPTAATTAPVLSQASASQAKPAAKEGKKNKAVAKAEPDVSSPALSAPVVTEAAPINEAPKEGKKKTKAADKTEPVAPSSSTTSAVASIAPTVAPTIEAAAPAKEQSAKAAVLRAPALKVDQHVALHAILTLLQQEVRTQATVVTANTGALKTHLLHGITRLGYTCIEGSAQSFQRLGWHTTDDCLDYSPPILKHPEQFLQSTKSKGDLKLETPALFVQLRAYPDFGADSPLLQGAKAFKAGFLRTIDEVAVGESDAFVFACAEKVYQEFALTTVPTLPATTTIQRHALTFALAHTTKNGAVSNLRSLLSRVENATGEAYIVAAVLP